MQKILVIRMAGFCSDTFGHEALQSYWYSAALWKTFLWSCPVLYLQGELNHCVEASPTNFEFSLAILFQVMLLNLLQIEHLICANLTPSEPLETVTVCWNEGEITSTLYVAWRRVLVTTFYDQAAPTAVIVLDGRKTFFF